MSGSRQRRAACKQEVELCRKDTENAARNILRLQVENANLEEAIQKNKFSFVKDVPEFKTILEKESYKLHWATKTNKAYYKVKAELQAENAMLRSKLLWAEQVMHNHDCHDEWCDGIDFDGKAALESNDV